MRPLLLVLPALLAACDAGSQIPLWTKDYGAQQTTRSYAADPATVLAAAERVVRLAGAPRDVQATPNATGATVDRYTTGFIGLHPVTNDYRFDIAVAPAGKGSTISLTLSVPGADEMSGDMMGLPTSPLLTNGPIRVADPYKLFFARLDYLLGQRPDWVTCAEAPAKLGASAVLDPLCANAIDVAAPPR